MFASPTRLSDCTSRWTLDDTPGDQYDIEIEPGTHLVIQAGAFPGTPSARFTHPNLAATVQAIYHFKVAPPRRWIRRAGISHYLIIPRDSILLLPERRYSYISAIINSVTVSFNVSGWTSGSGWTDSLRTVSEISVGHSLRHLRRLAAVAVRGTSLEPLPLTPLSPDDLQEWQQLAAHVNPVLKRSIFRLVESGCGPSVHLSQGYTHQGLTSGPGVALVRSWRPPKPVTAIILQMLADRVRVTLQQIDWFKTASVNGLHLDSTGTLPLPQPAQ